MKKLMAAWAALGVATASGCKDEAAAPRLIGAGPAGPQATSLSIQRAPSNSGDQQTATTPTVPLRTSRPFTATLFHDAGTAGVT
jgi:hypothetical protein